MHAGKPSSSSDTIQRTRSSAVSGIFAPMSLRSVVKGLESINRRITYTLLRGLLRNREIAAPVDPRRVRSILILRHDAIGDMIATAAAIDLIHRALPHAAVDMIASPRNDGVFRHDPRVRRIEVYRRGVGEILR